MDGLPNRWFYLISALVGFAVMGIELLAAKWMAPMYGSTIYVWASVIGTTLGALAAAYYLGGIISKFGNSFSAINWLLGAAGLFVLTSPFGSGLTMGMELKSGIVLSAILLLAPPLICLGAVTPILISKLAPATDRAGVVAGRVYALSTLSGVGATFLFGYWVLPYLGVKAGTLIIAALLLAAPIMMRIFKPFLFKHSVQ